jgi:hypothetical protein
MPSTEMDARQIGGRISYEANKWIDVPETATHVLIRPVAVKRGADHKVILAFFRASYPDGYKPRGNSGKYFCRRKGAKACRVEARWSPAGWHYKVDWN